MSKIKTKKKIDADHLFYIFTYIIVITIFLIVLLPLIHIIASSFSDVKAVQSGKVLFWPNDFSLAGYRAVFEDEQLVGGFLRSVYLTVVGTAISVCVTLMCAYPLSRQQLPGRKFAMFFFTFTMFFGGGMIPTYILIRDLHMINTYWALMIPGALSVYNMIIVRTYMQTNVPAELLEATRIDGGDDFQFFFKVLLPLSKSVIAVITLYYAVGKWNTLMDALIYINEQNKMPLQVILRQILINNTMNPNVFIDDILLEKKQGIADLMKYSLIIVSSIPMLAIFPFVQKHFVRGVMIGSVKG